MVESHINEVVQDEGHLCIDWLTYRSYEHNRSLSPHISAQSWGKIYYNAEAYEKIYQSQIKNIEDSKDDHINYRYA